MRCKDGHDLCIIYAGPVVLKDGQGDVQVNWCRQCGMIERDVSDLSPGARPQGRNVFRELPEDFRQRLEENSMNRDTLISANMQEVPRGDRNPATDPRRGDVWRAGDGRLIVVYGTRWKGLALEKQTVSFFFAGRPCRVRIESFGLFLLSCMALACGHVERAAPEIKKKPCGSCEGTGQTYGSGGGPACDDCNGTGKEIKK